MSRNDPTICLGDLSIVAGLTHDGDTRALAIVAQCDPDDIQVRDTRYAQEIAWSRDNPKAHILDNPHAFAPKAFVDREYKAARDAAEDVSSSVRETLRLENTPRQGRSDFWAEMIK